MRSADSDRSRQAEAPYHEHHVQLLTSMQAQFFRDPDARLWIGFSHECRSGGPQDPKRRSCLESWTNSDTSTGLRETRGRSSQL